MDNIKIAIPSYKRADRIRVFNWIPQSYAQYTYVFVREEEEAEYREKWGDRCTVVPITGVTGVATTMDAMVRYFDDERIWCIDDDVTLHLSRIDHKGLIRKTKELITESEFYECLDYINKELDNGSNYGHVFYPLFPRAAKYIYPTKYNVVTYGSGNIFFDLKVIDKSYITYSKIGYDEWCDAWVCMNLYKNGFKPVSICKWVSDPFKWNAPGGCSENRLASKLNEAMHKMAEDFPKYCKLRMSNRKDVDRLGIRDVKDVYTLYIRLK
jgi:hypothetical protein